MSCNKCGIWGKSQTVGEYIMHSKRQNEMIRYLSETRFARIEQLAELYHVSMETIRRDLLELEKDSAVKRVRGGVVYNSLRAQEVEYEKRMENNQIEKHAIAKLAAGYINDGDAIVLNNGTATLELARRLAEMRKQLTVVTNSPNIALVLNENKGISVYLTSGYLRKHNKSLVGSLCSDCLDNFKVDKAFVNIDGISIEDGVTQYNTEEAAVVRKMLDIGHTKIVLCEYSKFNEVAFNRVCPAEYIDCIFTDWNISPKEVKSWGDINIKVMVAPESVNSK